MFLNPTLYYFHGYGSTGMRSSKLISDAIGKTVLTVPWDSLLPYVENIKSMKVFIKERINLLEEDPVFIGSSTGAIYARVLANDFEAACVLHNPVVNPVATLSALGCPVAESYSEVPKYRHWDIMTRVFISMDDDILNPQEGIDFWTGHANVQIIGGKHRLERLSDKMIEAIKTIWDCPVCNCNC